MSFLLGFFDWIDVSSIKMIEAMHYTLKRCDIINSFDIFSKKITQWSCDKVGAFGWDM